MEEKVIRYNKKAMHYMHKGDNEKCLSSLILAQKLLKGIPITSCAKLMGITLNNLGCYYKAVGQPEQALIYLRQAIEIEKNNLTEVNNLAATHLNLCAIESQIGNHLQALDNCLEAIHLLKNEFKNDNKYILTFVSAHFNAGIEYKSLGKYPESRKILQIGLEISIDYLGHDHLLTSKFKEILNSDDAIQTQKRFHSVHNSPLKSIRSSTAATSIKRKIRKDLDKSNETLNYSLGKFSKGRISPLRYVKKFRENLEKTSGIGIKLKTRKVKKHKNKNKYFSHLRDSSDKAIQAISEKKKFSFKDIRNFSAILIQKTWKMYITRKYFQMNRLDFQISEAEEVARKAFENLERLKNRKLLSQGKPIIEKLKELIPIPYKAKLENKSSSPIKICNRRSRESSKKTTTTTFMLPRIIKLQSQIRKYLAKKHYSQIKALIIKIQKNWKGYQARKNYKKIYASIIKIQNFYHKYFCVKSQATSSNFSVLGILYYN